MIDTGQMEDFCRRNNMTIEPRSIPETHPKAGEERMLNVIGEIDILKERYRRAMETMDRFPAYLTAILPALFRR